MCLSNFKMNGKRAVRLVIHALMLTGLLLSLIPSQPAYAVTQVDTFNPLPSDLVNDFTDTAFTTTGTGVGLDYNCTNCIFLYDDTGSGGDAGNWVGAFSFGGVGVATITAPLGAEFSFESAWLSNQGVNPITISGTGTQPFSEVIAGDGTYPTGTGGPYLVNQVTLSGTTLSVRIDSVTVDLNPVVDTDPPGLISFERQTPATSPTNADTLVFRATFDEEMNPSTINNADFVASGTTAAVTGVSVDTANTVFDITVTGGDLSGLNGTVGLNLNSPTISDTAGNALPSTEPTTDETYVVDNVAPAAPGTPDLAAGSDTGSTSTDNITNDTTPQFTGTCETGTTVTLSSSVDGVLSQQTCSGNAFDITVIGALSQNTHNVTATQTDAAGNSSSASSALSVTVDTTKPDVTINQAGTQADPTDTSPVVFTAVFDEPINDSTFTNVDVSVGGTATTGTVTVTEIAPNDDTTFSVSIVVSADGTVTPTIPAGGVEDVAGNTNTVSTSTDNTVTVDTVKPGCTQML
jgi:hypothetical protein